MWAKGTVTLVLFFFGYSRIKAYNLRISLGGELTHSGVFFVCLLGSFAKFHPLCEQYFTDVF
jgi:hypothetical protein